MNLLNTFPNTVWASGGFRIVSDTLIYFSYHCLVITTSLSFGHVCQRWYFKLYFYF